MLLWIDKIVIPQKIFKTILSDSKFPENKIVQFIIEFYEKANLIEQLDTDKFFNDSTRTALENAVSSDLIKLTTLNPGLSHGSEDDHFVIRYNETDYCFPRLLSIYGDLFLSKEVGANCLFDPYSLEYCHLKFGLTAQNPVNTASVLSGIDKVLSTIIPSIHPYPTFIDENDNCRNCKKISKCQHEYYKELDSAMQQYLEWREYDEFYALRDCINKVISTVRNSTELIMPEDITNEFNQEKKRISSLIHRHLPKVKKFTDLITVISAPATIFSAVSGSSAPITIGAAVLSGASALTTVLSNRMEEKYKWINFSLNNK